MGNNIVTGLLYIFIAGIFSGLFAIPFKKNPTWKWENNWFVWSIVALLLAPWVVALATVPSLFTVLSADSTSLLLVIVFGLIWGYGAILFGKGIDLLGVSLGLPIMLGLINSSGTLLPLILKDPNLLLQPEGIKIVIGIIVILGGIIFYSIAGSKRDKELNGSGSKDLSTKGKSFKKGLIVAVLAGIFGPMINIAFVYGQPIQSYAELQGASPLYATNAIWCVVLSAGFIINALECIRLFRKEQTWQIYKGHAIISFIFPIISGIIWYLSIMFYGMGGNVIGANGASTGWAIMQSTAIIASCGSGILLGEWKGTSHQVKSPIYIGLLLLVIGIIIIAWEI